MTIILMHTNNITKFTLIPFSFRDFICGINQCRTSKTFFGLFPLVINRVKVAIAVFAPVALKTKCHQISQIIIRSISVNVVNGYILSPLFFVLLSSKTTFYTSIIVPFKNFISFSIKPLPIVISFGVFVNPISTLLRTRPFEIRTFIFVGILRTIFSLAYFSAISAIRSISKFILFVLNKVRNIFSLFANFTNKCFHISIISYTNNNCQL